MACHEDGSNEGRRRIGVLVVHGIGNQPPGYADAFIEALERRFRKKGIDDAFAFKAAYWGEVLERREDDLFHAITKSGAKLDHLEVRRNLVIGALGDAIAYAGRFVHGSWAYEAIHRAIARDLATLESLTGAGDAPLVVLSHSLGCQIVSNYVWDHQKEVLGRQFGKTPFTRGETFAAWITFGCNMPLFTLAREKETMEFIEFPGRRAVDGFSRCPPRELTAWINYYDPDDLLGFPLKGLGCPQKNPVLRDVAIQTGTVIGAHTDYWTDGSFIDPVAEHLAALAEYL